MGGDLELLIAPKKRRGDEELEDKQGQVRHDLIEGSEETRTETVKLLDIPRLKVE